MNYKNDEFAPWPKMARLSRECIITEKLDGTNACVNIVPTRELSILGDIDLATVHGDLSVEGAVTIFAGSRTRWIQPGNDNYGFAAWVRDNAVELAKLGPGRHFGEWWGHNIQRNYGLKERRFSLFNAQRWAPVNLCNLETPGVVEIHTREVVAPDQTLLTISPGPSCCHVVPTLYRGEFATGHVDTALALLKIQGSQAAPGFMNPEGVIIYHVAGKVAFKKTLDDDESPKSANQPYVTAGEIREEVIRVLDL